MSVSMKKNFTLYSFLDGILSLLNGVPIQSLKKKIRRISAWSRYKQNKNFLKKNHSYSWKQYRKDNDPDVIYRATIISQYYHGYPYLVAFENAPPASQIHWQDWLRQMHNWCVTNCSDKVRHDIHRVIREKGLIHNEYDDTMMWSDTEEFSMNDIGGHDVLFFAFKSEKDLAWFKLRWQ